MVISDQLKPKNTKKRSDTTNSIKNWPTDSDLKDKLDLKLNLISIDSPLARALIGKALDAEVRVQTPTGEQCVYIVAIEYL